MKLIQSLLFIEKGYAWSFSGFVLAAILGALSIYETFRDRHPHLRADVISDASVLDVREHVGNLEISYDGIEIQKARRHRENYK